MLRLPLNQLKRIVENRGLEGHRSMSKNQLSTFLNLSKSVKESENNFDDTKLRIKKIRKKFNELSVRFSKPKIKEIRKNLYKIENKKTFFTPKIKEI